MNSKMVDLDIAER